MRRVVLILALLMPVLFAASGPAGAADERLAEAQRSLPLLGFNAGKPDGTPQARTTQAIMAFQRQTNLPATGKLDDATLAAIRAAREKIGGVLGKTKASSAVGNEGGLKAEPKPIAGAQPREAIDAENVGGNAPPPVAAPREGVDATRTGASAAAGEGHWDIQWLWALVPVLLSLSAWTAWGMFFSPSARSTPYLASAKAADGPPAQRREPQLGRGGEGFPPLRAER